MYIAMDFLHFPDEADAKNFEASFPHIADRILFAGRVVQDPSRRYTHCVIWKFKDFDEYASNWKEFAANVNEDTPVTMAPGADHWWGCKVVDVQDPVLVEHGPEEWSRRDLQPIIELAKENEHVANWLSGLVFWSADNGNFLHRGAEYWMREQAGVPFKE